MRIKNLFAGSIVQRDALTVVLGSIAAQDEELVKAYVWSQEPWSSSRLIAYCLFSAFANNDELLWVLNIMGLASSKNT